MRLLTLIFMAFWRTNLALEIQPKVFSETMQGNSVPIFDDSFGMNCDSPSTYGRKHIRLMANLARKNRGEYPCHIVPLWNPKYPTLTFYTYPLGRRMLMADGHKVTDYLILNSEWFAVDGVMHIVGNQTSIRKFCSFLPGTSFLNPDKSITTISKDEAIADPKVDTIGPPKLTEAQSTNKQSEKTWNPFTGLRYPIIKDALRSNGLYG
ncbi:Bgt_BCG-13 [Blumeria graminis f. sp. tritici]|uniref:Bgt_BCG-13 n=1 Tax=Blumeria graminis f. sp. tritici TaxID=62690 RepID=A0A9X9LC82_BLUGR|nr:Bgt_BCG-13 [Blumeria graminis f. sp. tritici]